jgi:MFS transporter, FHS family, glucose/mannose:H+ symporter
MAQSSSRHDSSVAWSPSVLVLHAGFVVTGVVTTLLGPLLPILISRWLLTDRRAGLFFTAQFCGSMFGVASIGPLIKRGYRQTFICGFGLIAIGVAGLDLAGHAANLASVAIFGCGLGQALSTGNLWVAQVAGDRRVGAISILNLMWGLGAIFSSPLVMLAERHGMTPSLLYAIAASSAITALILATMNIEPDRTPLSRDLGSFSRHSGIRLRSALSLAALFFLYVGSENSVAGWAASLAKRMSSDGKGLWALAPMFFWGGIIAGRGIVPFVPLRRREGALLISGLALAATGACFLLRAQAFAAVAICVSSTGLGLAAIYPILISWLVKAFGEKSSRIGSIMFALAAMGGATMPWFVGVVSTGTGSLRDGLLVPLAGCVAMLALVTMMVEPVFREVTPAEDSLP